MSRIIRRELHGGHYYYTEQGGWTLRVRMARRFDTKDAALVALGALSDRSPSIILDTADLDEEEERVCSATLR
jgi:hypothetical protein